MVFLKIVFQLYGIFVFKLYFKLKAFKLKAQIVLGRPPCRNVQAKILGIFSYVKCGSSVTVSCH